MRVTHTKVSAKADSGDASLIQPSDWNADHVVDGAMPKLPIETGRYYYPIGHTGPGSNVTTDNFADLLMAVPFVSNNDITITRIGVYCAVEDTGIGAVLGIYPSGTDLKPDTENLLDSGTVDFTTPGAKEATVSVAITAGELYWIALSLESSGVVEVSQGNSYDRANMFAFYGTNSEPVTGGSVISFLQQNFTYDGTLPSPFGATTFGEGDFPAPTVWVRAV